MVHNINSKKKQKNKKQMYMCGKRLDKIRRKSNNALVQSLDAHERIKCIYTLQMITMQRREKGQ